MNAEMGTAMGMPMNMQIPTQRSLAYVQAETQFQGPVSGVPMDVSALGRRNFLYGSPGPDEHVRL